MTTKGTAVVRVEVQIKDQDNWGADCTLDQIRKQATKECVEELRKILEGHPNIRIISVSAVDIILTETPK